MKYIKTIRQGQLLYYDEILLIYFKDTLEDFDVIET